MSISILVLIVTAFLLTRASASIGFRLGLADKPDARKRHQGAIPLTGGVAIFLTILPGSLAYGILPYTPEMLTISSLLFVVGVFDDMRHISPAPRLAIQYCGGFLLATYGGVTIHNVGDLTAMGNIPLLWLSAPLTALAVAGLCNAYNMIDGIDGLAAASVSLPLLVLYLLAAQAAHPMADFLLLMLIPLGVFLVFNLGPNNLLLPKIFLGDGGSITLGFLVAASLVFFSQGYNALIEPVTALWLVTLPLMDMLATMLRRHRQGRHLMEADRSHLHHTLMDMGLSPRRTLGVLATWAIICASVGLALEAVPAYLSLCCYIGVFALHCGLVLKSESIGRRLNIQYR